MYRETLHQATTTCIHVLNDLSSMVTMRSRLFVII